MYNIYIFMTNLHHSLEGEEKKMTVSLTSCTFVGFVMTFFFGSHNKIAMSDSQMELMSNLNKISVQGVNYQVEDMPGEWNTVFFSF